MFQCLRAGHMGCSVGLPSVTRQPAGELGALLTLRRERGSLKPVRLRDELHGATCLPLVLCSIVEALASLLPDATWHADLDAGSEKTSTSISWDGAACGFYVCRTDRTFSACVLVDMLRRTVHECPLFKEAPLLWANETYTDGRHVWRYPHSQTFFSSLRWTVDSDDDPELAWFDKKRVHSAAFLVNALHVLCVSEAVDVAGDPVLDLEWRILDHMAPHTAEFAALVGSWFDVKRHFSAQSTGANPIPSLLPSALWLGDGERMMCVATWTQCLYLFSPKQPPWQAVTSRSLCEVCDVRKLTVKWIGFDSRGDLWVHVVYEQFYASGPSKLLSRLVWIPRPPPLDFARVRAKGAEWVIRDASSVDHLLPRPLNAATALACAEDTLVFADKNSISGIPLDVLRERMFFDSELS